MLPRSLQQFAPVQPGESESRTVGCRYKRSRDCPKNRMRNVCAFVREDGICLAPPVTWKRHWRKIVTASEEKVP